MDGELSEMSASNGRTEKSLFGLAVEQVVTFTLIAAIDQPSLRTMSYTALFLHDSGLFVCFPRCKKLFVAIG